MAFEDEGEIGAGTMNHPLRVLELDIATLRCIGTLDKSIHDPETGELNFAGTRADLSIEDVQAVMATLEALHAERVAARQNAR